MVHVFHTEIEAPRPPQGIGLSVRIGYPSEEAIWHRRWEFDNLSKAFWFVRTSAPSGFIQVTSEGGTHHFHNNCPISPGRIGDILQWTPVYDPHQRDRLWIEAFDLVKK